MYGCVIEGEVRLSAGASMGGLVCCDCVIVCSVYVL